MMGRNSEIGCYPPGEIFMVVALIIFHVQKVHQVALFQDFTDNYSEGAAG